MRATIRRLIDDEMCSIEITDDNGKTVSFEADPNQCGALGHALLTHDLHDTCCGHEVSINISPPGCDLDPDPDVRYTIPTP